VIQQRIFFEIGSVIYLPPPAVSQAVAELVYYNQDLKRVVIVTEKVPARDSRNCRFVCHGGGRDIIGANCLGMAKRGTMCASAGPWGATAGPKH
jgi:succinyl-CoA synthetase alpha subunit